MSTPFSEEPKPQATPLPRSHGLQCSYFSGPGSRVPGRTTSHSKTQKTCHSPREKQSIKRMCFCVYMPATIGITHTTHISYVHIHASRTDSYAHICRSPCTCAHKGKAPYIHLIPYSYIKMHLQSTHTPYTNMHTYSIHSWININEQHVFMQKSLNKCIFTVTQIYTLPQINRDICSMYLRYESLYRNGCIHTCLYKHRYAHILPLHISIPNSNKHGP